MLDRVLRPASSAVAEMIYKEENILLPMCLDTLAVDEWWEIARQSPELGFCLYDPVEAWRPPGMAEAQAAERDGQRIRLPSGSFSLPELTAILNTVPVDMTFVDKDDTVRFFTQGKERVFSRSRAIIGRKVQFCHPPSSVDVVDRILEGFRAGKQDRAEFWIELRGRFVHIEYLAMRGEGGEYLGCLEVSQDLTAKRALTGEQRLLSWAEAQPIPAPPTALDARIAAARCPAPAARPAPAPAERAAPAWASPEKVTKTLDARPLLAQGLHPVDQVVAELSQLAPGEVFALVTPFVPAPLVERALSLGVAAHSVSESPGVVRTYFARDQ